MLFSNPRVLPALLLCIGLGVMLIRGQELDAMPSWTQEDIETAVELNLALDLARMNRDAPDQLSPAEKAEHRERLRQEIQETFIDKRAKLEAEYRQGQWMAIAGGVLMVLVLILQQRGIIGGRK